MGFEREGLAFGGFDAHAAKGIGEGFEEVVEFVADVADGESGLVADLIVFEILVVFEADEVSLFGWEFGEEELEGSDGFEFVEGEVGFR